MKKGVGEKSIEALRVFSAHGELKVSEWIKLSGMVGLSKGQRWAQERFIKRLWCQGLLARSYEHGSYGHRVYKLSDRGSELLRGVNMGSKQSMRLCDFYRIVYEGELQDGLQVMGEMHPHKWNEQPVYVWAFFPKQDGPKGSWVGHEVEGPASTPESVCA